ncbi:neutrophil gelatinase-associated lipocalin isoform X3 [Pteropus medius]|uniref:neutrophil gelatinase-associated lipocalin isoform X3 n=1 Tax=Pteropus vampyrus TaxID=132908 RepID=UPI00196AF5DE|nr:neutrophil gelatinase-associated lipocalin isoform X3 [Pteropus giganteus]
MRESSHGPHGAGLPAPECLDLRQPGRAHMWTPRVPTAMTGLGHLHGSFSPVWPRAPRSLVTACLGTSCPALQESQRPLLLPQPSQLAEHHSQASGNQSRGLDWIPEMQCSPYTPQPGLGLSRGLLEVRDDSSTRSEPLTTNRANQSRRNGYRECQGTLCPCQRCGSPGSAAAQCPHPEIMTLGLLWLGLTLLGALQTQAQASTPNLIPAPPLLKVPLQQDFQDDQFQGKWYVVGLAGNAVSKEEQGKFKMYSTTYQLKEDHSYNVTSILFRDQNCDYFIRTFVPSFQPGQFSLGNIKAYPEVQSYTVRVVATNYHQFAMVFFKKVSKNKEYFKITLYGRTKELTPELKEDFVHFTKSLGLTDDHILFPVPIDKCIDE